MTGSFQQAALSEVARIFAPLRSLGDGKAVAAFVRSLGWQLPNDVELEVDLHALIARTEEVLQILQQFSSK
jgi:hypothetical protein